MIKKILIITILLFAFVQSNSKAAPSDSLYHLTLTGAIGYGHFFNNFENVESNDISNNLPVFIGRIMWKPNFLLSLGLESGYYFLFKTHDVPALIGNDKMSSNMALIPIFLHVAMNVYDNFNISLSSGYSLMSYEVESDEGVSTGTELSLSNFALALSYDYPLNNNWLFGAELSYLRIGLTEDDYINLNIYASFNLLSY